MKKVLIPLYALLLSMLAFSLPAAASDKAFNELIIISGTLSDIGNFASVHGNFPPPFFNNRTTNGPNLEDFFSANIGFTNTASLHLIGPPVGNNFAVFQALASGHGPEDLPAEIDAYLNSRGGVANPDALFFVFIGGSDVIKAAFEVPDDAAASQLLSDAVKGIETAIRRLVAAGAKTVFAPNFTDLGTTPAARKLGIIPRATRISKEYNKKFEAMLDRIDRDLKFDLIRWDFFGFSHDLLRNAASLGYTNTTDACVDLLAAGQCDFDRFVFMTDFFPTSKTHRLFANGVTQVLIERGKDRRKHDRD